MMNSHLESSVLYAVYLQNLSYEQWRTEKHFTCHEVPKPSKTLNALEIHYYTEV